MRRDQRCAMRGHRCICTTCTKGTMCSVQTCCDAQRARMQDAPYPQCPVQGCGQYASIADAAGKKADRPTAADIRDMSDDELHALSLQKGYNGNASALARLAQMEQSRRSGVVRHEHHRDGNYSSKRYAHNRAYQPWEVDNR